MSDINSPYTDNEIITYKERLRQFITKLLQSVITERELLFNFLDNEATDIWVLAFTSPAVDAIDNYERLETLGDGLIHGIVTMFLYNKYPDIDPHRVTVIRNYLVNNKYHAKMASQRNFGSYLRAPQGIEVMDGILADCYEAFFGALLTIGDSIGQALGLATVYQLFVKWYSDIDVESIPEPAKTFVKQAMLKITGEKIDSTVKPVYLTVNRRETIQYHAYIGLTQKQIDSLEFYNVALGVYNDRLVLASVESFSRSDADEKVYELAMKAFEKAELTEKIIDQIKRENDIIEYNLQGLINDAFSLTQYKDPDNPNKYSFVVRGQYTTVNPDYFDFIRLNKFSKGKIKYLQLIVVDKSGEKFIISTNSYTDITSEHQGELRRKMLNKYITNGPERFKFGTTGIIRKTRESSSTVSESIIPDSSQKSVLKSIPGTSTVQTSSRSIPAQTPTQFIRSISGSSETVQSIEEIQSLRSLIRPPSENQPSRLITPTQTPIQPSRLITPIQPTQPSRLITPIQPTQSSRLITPIQPTQSSRLITPIQPTQPSRLITPIQPTQPSIQSSRLITPPSGTLSRFIPSQPTQKPRRGTSKTPSGKQELRTLEFN